MSGQQGAEEALLLAGLVCSGCAELAARFPYPRLPPPLPAGAARTFYLYHQLVASGGASNFVLGPGPVPPSHPLLTNPGLAVVSVVDDSAAKPYQLRVTLKNISGRTLTDSDLHYLNSPAPLTFTLTAASPPALDIVALMGRVV